MARYYKHTKGDVEWHFPKQKKNFRPFTYSTVSVSDWINLLSEGGHTVQNAIAKCHYCPEGRKILEAYAEAGYADVLLTKIGIRSL